jgi:hypothetical protein
VGGREKGTGFAPVKWVGPSQEKARICIRALFIFS